MVDTSKTRASVSAGHPVLLRGRTLSFDRAPTSMSDQSAFHYQEDGGVLIIDGLICDAGEFSTICARHPDVDVIDHRPDLLMAGFIDLHLHFPQVQVIASWGEQLLDWLHTYTFPAEAAFSNFGHAQNMASQFFDLLTDHGTTTAVAFCSSHKTSAEAYFAEAHRRDMRMIGGKVMMDRNAPNAVLDTAQSGYDDTNALIKKWHNNGRLSYAISPRFAITSTPAQMEASQCLAAEHPTCFVQTHLSENHDEIEYTRSLYPDAPDYLGIYEHYGLLGPNTLLGHCIHLNDREVDVIGQTQSRPVFCPTSNLFLGSGLYNLAHMDNQKISTGIATDIGGGTSYSMLTTLNEGYKILQLQGQRLSPFGAFYWITRGNADVLGMADKIGTLDIGSEADIVVLNAKATPAMDLRMQSVKSLAEELFVLQIMGDDRAIAQTYVGGVPQKAVR